MSLTHAQPIKRLSFQSRKENTYHHQPVYKLISFFNQESEKLSGTLGVTLIRGKEVKDERRRRKKKKKKEKIGALYRM